MAPAGTRWEIRYDVLDSSKNRAVTAVRVVTIVDRTRPVLALKEPQKNPMLVQGTT
jgi:hypothetical protein